MNWLPGLSLGRRALLQRQVLLLEPFKLDDGVEHEHAASTQQRNKNARGNPSGFPTIPTDSTPEWDSAPSKWDCVPGIHPTGLHGSLGKAEDHQTGRFASPTQLTQSQCAEWKNGTGPSKMGLSHQKWDWASPSPILFVTPQVNTSIARRFLGSATHETAADDRVILLQEN
ncbi:hypothetical protein GGX14DRAFT_403089 [Mycena pura]|uniref:Uncharacterized protein n=1 Tax=Mycena pura TaxID=153505 RepID=A0AAD6V0S0_9AGAR|nr:hypothetical protein GGX14DRAFT_403089 [Mycena pura]